ncbi:GGDEF domain-containing protein [Undibacterium sp. Dicai25W]|uniref:GGDEF domain-containing protein n=1 Tax=Undibacterium sp. Dicai25W TaxID=3413034 RepID=UPI003BEFB529
MTQFLSRVFCIVVLLIVGSTLPLFANSNQLNGQDSDSNDAILNQISLHLRNSPELALPLLEQLKQRESSLSEPQKNRFYLEQLSSLALRGKYEDEVEIIEKRISNVKDPNEKARYLYHLSDAYALIGKYEAALKVVNQSIALLPTVTDANSKIGILQGAYSVLSHVHAYDDAMIYADRLYNTDVGEVKHAKCIGIGDRMEIYFSSGRPDQARKLLPEVNDVCRIAEYKIVVAIANVLKSIDLIDSGEFSIGIKEGEQALANYSKIDPSSDYVSHLEEALARAHLAQGRLDLAERYGQSSYLHAAQGKFLQLQEKANETMSKTKQAQGQYVTALEYADTALKLKNNLLDQQLQKNIAYQRVKFDMQDKANQLTLLEQKNKLLSIEKQLDKKNNQVLLLFIGLIVVALLLVGVWLWKVIQQKNIFKRHAQVDALTQISNRRHFIDITTAAVAERTAPISLILFDMDFFKKINDNFGHPTGDWVLIHVCQAVTEVLRKGDMFGRLGGEEFAICMPAADTHVAKQLAERCRLAIAAIDTEPSGFRFPLTASFGIATIDTYTVSTFEALMESADKALYKSKADGRNCVSVFE